MTEQHAMNYDGYWTTVLGKRTAAQLVDEFELEADRPSLDEWLAKATEEAIRECEYDRDAALADWERFRDAALNELIEAAEEAAPRPPVELFNLVEVDRIDLDGTTWAIYRDSDGTFAIEAASLDEPTKIRDYSDWCSRTIAVGDPDLCARLARLANIDGIHLAGTCTWTPAAADDDVLADADHADSLAEEK